jgi:alpha-amylase
VNTEDEGVIAIYGDWIQNLVQKYGIDGLRIDGVFFPHVSLFFLTKLYFSCQVDCPPLSTFTCVLTFFRHVNINFWPTFCASAGVFCIGEVMSDIE